jgi:hypothetical protein
VTNASFHRTLSLGRIWMVGLLLMLSMSTAVVAAVSQGPTPKNPYEEKKRRDMNFYEAKQSFEDKVRVGQERYNQSQTNRAKIIASMAAQFQARQQIVAVEPSTTAAVKPRPPIKGLKPLLAVLILAGGFFGFGYYLYVNREREPVAPKPKRRE